jgi:hypothetical protein
MYPKGRDTKPNIHYSQHCDGIFARKDNLVRHSKLYCEVAKQQKLFLHVAQSEQKPNIIPDPELEHDLKDTIQDL